MCTRIKFKKQNIVIMTVKVALELCYDMWAKRFTFDNIDKSKHTTQWSMIQWIF